jgi:hypothetical protein
MIEIGPPTTVGAVLAAKPGDPPLPGRRELLVNPTAKDVYDMCRMKLDEEGNVGKGEVDEGKEKPVFGPEKPPGMP